MGSSTYNDVSEKQLEDELIDTGSRLLMLPSSTNELLVLLEKAERLLTKVRQQPPRSTGHALLPAMKALVTDELLRHTDVNIQVAVASCINELTRITAPNPPYNDDEMKQVFQLFIIAFQQLSGEPGPNYFRAAQILETVAKVRSCLILLDIDCDALIVEIFQLFLTTFRSDHPSNILKHMEMIMILVIEESDEISFELLRPLLASIRMDNKSISPASCELGKTVFKTCTTKLQLPLREAVKTMNLDVDDYARILSSLCEDTSSGKNTVAKEVVSAVKAGMVGLAGAGVSKLDERSSTSTEDTTSPTKGDWGNENLISNSARANVKGVDAAGLPQLEMHNGAVKRRGKRHNSLINSKDGHKGNDSCEVSRDGENKEVSNLPSKHVEGSLPKDSSQKEHDNVNEASDNVNEVSVRKRGRPKKKESMINQNSNLEFSSTQRGSVLQTTVKESCSNTEKSIGKKSVSGSRTTRAKKEDNLDNEMSGKDALPLQELLQRKQNDEIIPHKHESMDVRDKMEKSRSASREKTKYFPSKVDKTSGSSRVDYGWRLVNARIQVWWPMDKEFYAGTVKAYDPLTKKHKIKYDDEEEEILNLKKERWETLPDQKPGKGRLPQKQDADQISPAKGPVKTLEKTAKRKSISSRKQDTSSSSTSKRPKGESRRGFKSGENFAPDKVHRKDEHSIKTSGTKLSPKDGGNHAGKEEMGTTTDKMEPSLDSFKM